MGFMARNVLAYYRFIPTIAALLAVTSCEPASRAVSPSRRNERLQQFVKDSPVLYVAVLPVQNLSVDPRSPELFRKLTCDLLQAKGYTVLATKPVDNELGQLGVQHADQIPLLTYPQLNQRLKADLCVSAGVKMSTTQAAIGYHAYSYTLALKVHDKDGEILWENDLTVSKRRWSADPVVCPDDADAVLPEPSDRFPSRVVPPSCG